MILTTTLNISVDRAYKVNSLIPGTVIRVQECSYTAGGKGLNVARIARIAGAEVIATGFCGGFSGELIELKLLQMKLKFDFVHVNGETRSCINVIDNSTGQQTEFLEPGFKVSAEDLISLKNKFSLLAESAGVITISGSAPSGCGDAIYAELIGIAKEKGKSVILDSSGLLLKEGVKAHPTMIKPNLDELSFLAGRKLNDIDSIIAFAKEIHKSGIEYVAVSLGKDGALMICSDGVFKGIAPTVKAINTVGCGDAMVAAFAIGLERRMNPSDMLRYALGVSASNALTMETGSFSPEQLPEIMDKCTVLLIS